MGVGFGKESARIASERAVTFAARLWGFMFGIFGLELGIQA